MFEVQMQFIPKSNVIWVARLDSTDPIYQYDDEVKAQDKATELQNNDLTGRKYRVVKL